MLDLMRHLKRSRTIHLVEVGGVRRSAPTWPGLRSGSRNRLRSGSRNRLRSGSWNGRGSLPSVCFTSCRTPAGEAMDTSKGTPWGQSRGQGGGLTGRLTSNLWSGPRERSTHLTPLAGPCRPGGGHSGCLSLGP